MQLYKLKKQKKKQSIHTQYCKLFICSKWKVCHSVREGERGLGSWGRLMSLVHTLVEGTLINQWEKRKRHLSLQLSQKGF